MVVLLIAGPQELQGIARQTTEPHNLCRLLAPTWNLNHLIEGILLEGCHPSSHPTSRA
jgi:hypothetical protein